MRLLITASLALSRRARKTFSDQKGWMRLPIKGTSVLSKSKNALTVESLLMCLSRTGMGLVLSRGRVFRLGNSMLISLSTIWGTDTFVCPSGNELVFSYLDHAHQKN